jgi:hypothetical protein
MAEKSLEDALNIPQKKYLRVAGIFRHYSTVGWATYYLPTVPPCVQCTVFGNSVLIRIPNRRAIRRPSHHRYAWRLTSVICRIPHFRYGTGDARAAIPISWCHTHITARRVIRSVKTTWRNTTITRCIPYRWRRTCRYTLIRRTVPLR